MSIGYEGYAVINGKLLLATSASAPLQRNRLESQAGYGGTASLSSNQGIGYPHNYDLDSYDGSVGFELTSDFYNGVLHSSLLNRINPLSVQFQTRGNESAGLQSLPQCYWTSINITAAETALVTSTINYITWYKNSGAGGTYSEVIDDYTDNRNGTISNNLAAFESVIPPLNPSQVKNTVPIPFWNTKINWGGNANYINWNATLNQEMTKAFTCRASNSGPYAPDFIIFGPLTGEFTGEIVIINDAETILNGSGLVPDSISNLQIVMASSFLNLGYCETNTFADDLVTGSGTVPINLSYNIYGPIS